MKRTKHVPFDQVIETFARKLIAVGLTMEAAFLAIEYDVRNSTAGDGAASQAMALGDVAMAKTRFIPSRPT